MASTRSTEARLGGLEKAAGELEKGVDLLNAAVSELNTHFLKIDERVTAIGSQLEMFIAEVRAALPSGKSNKKNGSNDTGSSDDMESNTAVTGGSPPMTIPTFDGADAIVWLARAEQYFLVSNVPPENRVKFAMVALAGPVLPWFQLLKKRIPTLSWDRFTQEMMK